MLFHRRITRDFLLYKTDKKEFLDILYKAKITPRQREILLLKLLDKQDYRYISDMVFVTEHQIKKDIEGAYDLIYHYLLNTNLLPKQNHL